MSRIVAALVGLLAGCGGSDVPRAKDGDHGQRVLRYSIRSGQAGRTLRQVAVRPANAGARPPLLVFLHGRGGSPEGQADPRFLSGLAKGKVAVVFPSGGLDSYWHDRATGRWGSYVMREVIPEAIRRLHADPRRVAIGGISMGGFGALDLARLHPKRFCAAGGHSAALWQQAGETAPGAFDDASDFARHDVIRAARTGAYRGAPPVRLDTGEADPFRPGDTAMASALGVPLHSGAGGHEPAYWRAHYAQYAAWYARRLRDC